MTLPRCQNQFWLWFCVAASLALASCGRKTPPQKISPQAAKQARLDWNLETLVGAYQRGANTGAKWDEPAKRALTEFAGLRSSTIVTDEDSTEIMRTNCQAAVEAGCDDPMIRYLYIRFCMDQTNSPQDFARAFCDVALEMQKSSYPNIRKLFAAIRAIDQLFYAYGTNAMSMPEIREMGDLVPQNLYPTIQDTTVPPAEACDACKEALKETKGNAASYAQRYSSIEGTIFNNWPNESESWLLKGEAYFQMAWNARGSGYASTVTDKGAKDFAANLAVAGQSLKRAWELNPKDPRIAVKLIWVELGQGKGRDRMELWFQNAMQLDPNNYDACSAKLLYLEPKWYGSVQEMLNFGRQCVQNSSWGGRVPLALMDAHYDISRQYTAKSEQADYWKRPEVWTDAKAAYDRFFALNPNATDVYWNYAWYAYHAEQWDAFNELAPKVRPVDYNFFGVNDEFDKMVQLAKAHVKSTAPKQ